MQFLTKWKRLLFYTFLMFLIVFFIINYVNLKLSASNEIVIPRNEPVLSGNFPSKKMFIIKNNTTTKSNQNTRKRYFALDGNNMGSINSGLIKCSESLEVEVLPSADAKVDFVYFLDIVHSVDILSKSNQKPYTMVYGMESEPHSAAGDSWLSADFRMWYNLDLSFPEPATYFDVSSYLPDLLSPPKVEFKDKESNVPLCWILSNCNAFNGREKFVKRLMELISVDSYGYCLRNKNSHSSNRMHGNIELYAKYKFVLAIENSNCADYVTEKLVHTVGSGSIPVVAGRDGKPDYLRYLPKGSFINVYDFKSVEELAAHLKLVGSSEAEYEKYMRFKRHNYTRQFLRKLPLREVIELAKGLIDPSEQFFSELVLKEKSENKLCKIARYLKETPAKQVEQEIKMRKIKRPSTSETCLPPGNLGSDFFRPKN